MYEAVLFLTDGFEEMEAITVLDDIAVYIAELFPGQRIEVWGHTDSIPINTPQFASNWELSLHRALSVSNRLVNEHGFDGDLIVVIPRADLDPVAPNDTPENRAKNRRVEIRIIGENPDTANDSILPTNTDAWWRELL